MYENDRDFAEHVYPEGAEHVLREVSGLQPGDPIDRAVFDAVIAADEFVSDVRGLRDRTGLDGLWLDSYCSFTHFIRTADPQFPLRQGEANRSVLLDRFRSDTASVLFATDSA